MSILSRIFGSRKPAAVDVADLRIEIESLMVRIQQDMHAAIPGTIVHRDCTHFHAVIDGLGAAVPFDEFRQDFETGIAYMVLGLKSLRGARGE